MLVRAPGPPKMRPVVVLFILMTGCSVAEKFEDLLPDIISRLQDVGEVLVPIPEDVLAEGLFNLGSYFIPVDAESELCRNHSATLFQAFLNNQIWAAKMVDASSKVGSGLLEGNMMDLGSYDTCLGIEAPEGLFTGQLCVVETKGILPSSIEIFNSERQLIPTMRNDVMFSLCVPSSCTAQDVRAHMDVALNSVNASAILYNSSCSSAAPLPLEKTDIFTISVLLCIACLIISSTIYDYMIGKAGENQLLSSFSVRRNTRQLFAAEHTRDTLQCLHGLRVIAMAWVILGHRMLHLLSLPLTRFGDLYQNKDSLAWAPIQESFLSVEIFFIMSGLLVTYKFLKERLNGKKFSYLSFVFDRYTRLVPALAMMVLLNATLVVHFSNGPIWLRMFSLSKESCQTQWWSNLLFINNYYDVFNMCMIQSWYLSADFQMHLICPVILFVLHKNKVKGLTLVSVAIVASITASLAYSTVWNLRVGAFLEERARESDAANGYFQTQYRAASFLMGIFLGYFIYMVKKEQLIIKPSKVVLVLYWLLSTLLILGSVFGVTLFLCSEHIHNPWIDPIYLVLHRYTFALGVAWIIFVCTIGFGGFVNDILSWSALVPISRLTYGAYLVHYLIQDVQALSTRRTISLSIFSPWYLFCADYLISYVAAGILYLTVEAPFTNILKYKKTTKQSSQDTNISDMVVLDKQCNI